MSSHAARQKIYTQRRRAGRIIVSVEVDEQALTDALVTARLLSPLAVDDRVAIAHATEQLIEFHELPHFFKDEDELRKLWSLPTTRKALLQGLAEKGFGRTELTEIGRLISAEKSDVFDVLAYVAYASPPITRVRYWHKADMPSCTAHVRFRG